MSSPSPGKRRMDTDVIKLMTSRHQVKLLGGLNEFIVKFEGPVDTPYYGGYWNIRVELPDRYPYKSPSIGFMNRIFHPNIDEPSGSVCLDVINQTWTPLYDLKNIFEQFLPQLLTYPNPSDPLNGEAATMYIQNKDAYIKRVKDSIKLYATEAILAKQSKQYMSDDEDEEISKSIAPSRSINSTQPTLINKSTLRKSPEQDSNDSALVGSFNNNKLEAISDVNEDIMSDDENSEHSDISDDDFVIEF